jgi:hypothetical protein
LTEDLLEEQQRIFEEIGPFSFCPHAKHLIEQPEKPKTHKPSPQTFQTIKLSTGSSHEATALRQKMQTAQLKSDMEAFKAANPGSSLEDFVQWHSPRDWIAPSKDSPISSLSVRMKEEGNLWAETWKLAGAVPAGSQKALFNLNQEAMKALHYLENMTIDSLVEQFVFFLFDFFFSLNSFLFSLPFSFFFLPFKISLLPIESFPRWPCWPIIHSCATAP